jgi:hypothetical protein
MKRVIKANSEIGTYKGYSIGMEDTPPQKCYFVDDKGHVQYGESEEHVKSMIDSYLEHGKVYAANYGGAYDVDPEQFFTKDDIVEFADSLVQALNMDGDYPDGAEWGLSDVYMETPNTLVVELESPSESVEVVKEKIDMRKIKKPTDVFKYMTSFEKKFLDKLYGSHDIDGEQYYTITKIDTKTDKEANYGGGHTEQDVKAITRGYTFNGLFYERKGSRYIFIVE